MFAATVLNSNRAVPLIGTDWFKFPSPAQDCRACCWRAVAFPAGGDGISGLLEQTKNRSARHRPVYVGSPGVASAWPLIVTELEKAVLCGRLLRRRGTRADA